MCKLLDGQVAIITGAGRGIGVATAELFAQHGARVVVSDRDAEPAEAVVERIGSTGGQAFAVAGDVTAPAFPDQLVEQCLSQFGAVHILVNNAGYT